MYLHCAVCKERTMHDPIECMKTFDWVCKGCGGASDVVSAIKKSVCKVTSKSDGTQTALKQKNPPKEAEMLLLGDAS